MDYLSGAGKFCQRTDFPMPQLVLLDLKLPLKTGFEVLEWMRNQPDLRFLPVIVFSSSAQKADIDRAYQLGANSFVVKPSGVEERTELATLIKGFWLHFNRLPSMFASEV